MNSCEISDLRMKEIARLRAIVHELNQRLEQGRHYLMGVNPSKLTVEDALEAFGYDRCGFEPY
jgi:5-enolpyruvylshikimate-3-phosphate synthase